MFLKIFFDLFRLTVKIHPLVFNLIQLLLFKDKIFKVDDNCYKYTHEQVKCSDDNSELTF